MSNLKHLPADAAAIADQQGWDDESVIVHLVGFITIHSTADLAAYFASVADEENAEGDDHDGQPDEAQEWADFDPDC